MTVWLRDPGASEDVLGRVRNLVEGASSLPGDAAAVVAFAPELWRRWTGSEPEGAPPGGWILDEPPFRDTGGDVWVYLKADSDAGIEAVSRLAAELLEPVAERTASTRGALPPDLKILDHQFVDGITSPGDPVSLATRVLRADGSCWLLAQRFDILWSAFAGMSLDEQQDTIGRNEQGVLIPQPDARSHVKRVRALAQDESNLELLRQSLPFGRAASGAGREQGLYFVGFGSDAAIFATLLERMLGGPEGVSDQLLDVVRATEGGCFYVPSADELGLATGLDPDAVVPAPLWRVRSRNGLMFYNSPDYLHAMASGDYQPGDPPSERILALLGKVLSRWQDKWYRLQDTPRLPPLADFLDPGEEGILDESPVVRRAVSIERMLTRAWTTTDYPLPRGSWAWQADLFRIDPDDLLAGVMPELSLGRGKEVIPYLTDDERLGGFLALLDETSSMGHVIPDHEKLLRLGLGAIHEDLAQREAAAPAGDERDFYRAARITVEGIQGYCENYALLAERMAADLPGRRDQLEELAARMRKLRTSAPETFVEAAQSIFNLHCCLHLTGEPVSIGRLDQLLAPFFDPERESKAQEVLDALWVKLGEKALHNRQNATDHVTYGTTGVSYAGGNFAQGDGINQWVQQVTVGGYLPNDLQEPEPGANRLTLLCLRSARRLPLNAPVLSLRVYPGMDEEIVREAARTILSGGSHPILWQEDRMVRALSEFAGLPLEDARNYACDGCYEPMIVGKSEFAFSNVIALDALELALNEGARFDQSGPVYLRGWKLSWRSPPAAEIESFEQLQELYLSHLRYLTVQFFTSVLGNYGALWTYCPSPFLSTFIEGCVESGRDLSNGGAARHLLAPMYLALATTIDSLYAIKKLVFDQDTAEATLPELVEALRSDWGHAMQEPLESTLAGPLRSAERAEAFKRLRRRALDLPRFGMGDPEVDALGGWLIENVCSLARGTLADPPPPLASILTRLRTSYSLPDRPWEVHLQVGVGTFEAYVGDALQSGASADGRRAYQPFPSDFSPAPVPQDLPPIPQEPLDPRFYRPAGQALASWNQPAMNWELSNGGPVDLNIREDFPLEALEDLIRAYADGRVGANLLTLTCADPDTYAAAADQPERYELVRVRMGGWTEFFAAMFPAHHEQHRRRPFVVP